MPYDDHNHPSNADYRGEEPTTVIDVGPTNICVTLDAWGPQENLFTTLYDTSTSTYGEHPTRSGLQPCREGGFHYPEDRLCSPESWEHATGWCRLHDDQRKWLENAFNGATLQQDLEGINFWFTINGVTRVFTEQFNRTRLGAAFKQHGGRDNDWRHRRWTMPEALHRACEAYDAIDENNDQRPPIDCNGRKHPITDWETIDAFMGTVADMLSPAPDSLFCVIEDYLSYGKRLYAALVDAGISWQDARRLLPMGTQSYIHGVYNYVGLRGVLANRLEYVMDWEINCVCQLMLREIKMKCPPLLSQFLGSHSDRAGKAMFDRLELSPPDGKYPSTTIRCQLCHHAEGNHRKFSSVPPDFSIPNEMICEVCEREGTHAPMHRFVPEDTLPRIYRREQHPFWVLHPNSMKGGPIQWLWTNGHYHDIDSQLTEEAF